MRCAPLPREQELKGVFEKLHKYVGKSVEQLVNRSDAPHVFRLHKKARRAAAAPSQPHSPPPLAASSPAASHSMYTTCEKT